MLLLLVLFLSGQVALQPRPDYSGVWELTDRRGLTPDVDRALEIRQWTAPVFLNLTVLRRTASGVRSEDYMIGVAGGVVSGIASGAPRAPVTETRFSVHWDGRDLLIENTKDSLERQERWSLDSRGRLVVTVTVRAEGAPPTTSTRTYRRVRANAPDGGTTRYFKEDHLTGADYLAFIPDGNYQRVNREHTGVWFVEAGASHRSRTRVELTPRQRDRKPYSGVEVVHRGRTFLAWETEEAPGIVVSADETKRQLDENPRVLPPYVFFEISKAVHDRETRETYPFRTGRLNHP
jgi:hypothetical protein